MKGRFPDSPSKAISRDPRGRSAAGASGFRQTKTRDNGGGPDAMPQSVEREADWQAVTRIRIPSGTPTKSIC
jgi:hypothetical protein